MDIKVSESAKEELKRVQKEKEEEKAIRVYVAGQGWAGPSFGLALDEQNDEDLSKEIDGLKFIYEDYFEEGFKNVSIDFSKEGFQKGFTVTADAKDM